MDAAPNSGAYEVPAPADDLLAAGACDISAPALVLRAGAYDVVAPAYDLLTAGYEYEPWLRAIERLAVEHGLAGRRALDVACGTGKSLSALLDLGFEAVGCDGSPGMAAVARRKLAGRAAVHVADMRALPIYGRFDLVTCLDDAINHLPSAGDVEAALRAMAANLARGGLLAFDVNTLSAYRQTGDRIVEDDERMVLWHGGPARLEVPGGRAEVSIDVMSRCGDGLWRRTSASWGHWHYPLEDIRAIVTAAGLDALAIRGQRPGGRLEPGADEHRHPKALFLVGRPRSEGRMQCPGSRRHVRWRHTAFVGAEARTSAFTERDGSPRLRMVERRAAPVRRGVVRGRYARLDNPTTRTPTSSRPESRQTLRFAESAAARSLTHPPYKRSSTPATQAHRTSRTVRPAPGIGSPAPPRRPSIRAT